MPETTTPKSNRDRFVRAMRALAAGASQTAATSAQMALLAPPAGSSEDWYR